ncbi:MAG: cobalamin adenosyltransferase [Clostridia bacterium]|nr:cobalamin adenosyltransferase [Clostridia bacterium]
MELINEAYIKKLINEGTVKENGTIKVGENHLFTPSAIEYLHDKNIRVVRGSESKENATREYHTVFGGVLMNKPEHMTHLKGDVLVFKDHPIIKYRGALDYLESKIILAQIVAEKEGYKSVVDDLEEIISLVRKLIRFEITGEKLNDFTLLGLNAEQMRDHSHHSTKHYGISHFLPSYKQGEIVAKLNALRTLARKTELVAYDAFKDGNKNVVRDDIIQALNRLSSVFWIMMCKFIKGLYKRDDSYR